MLTAEETTQFLGMTLADFAAQRGTHPNVLREEYRRRVRLGEELTLPEVTRRVDDPLPEGDGTIKFCLPAGEHAAAGIRQMETESVIIPMISYRGTNWFTLCVSSQIGCRMACTFCETGRMGLLKNLLPGEIVRQRLIARRLREQVVKDAPPAALPPGEREWRSRQHRYFSDGIQNIVFMGMGEPLDNFEHVIQAIRVLNEPVGFDFPLAQITVSTVGRIDGLRKLAALAKSEPAWRNLRIAISLNAANDTLRDELMPVNRGMPLADLKRALLEYPLAARGRYLIEYVLIKGVNDSATDAQAVADFCLGLRCIVNLIPYNPQRFAAYETPADEVILAFMAGLKDRGIFVKRRITHGRDLMGACGQLGNPEHRRTSSRTLNVLADPGPAKDA